MRFNLTFSCDNAAFRDGQGKFSLDEVAWVLRRILPMVEEEQRAEGIIKDRYGNTIGAWYIAEED